MVVDRDYFNLGGKCGFLIPQRETGLTKGNLSAYLSKLEEAGYVRIEKTFKDKLSLTVSQLTAAGSCRIL